MSEPSQVEFWQQPQTVLAKLEARLRADRLHGLLLWTGVLRRVFDRITKRRVSVYEQCMLLEAEVEAGADSVVLLERLDKIKGLVAAFLLGLCLYQALDGSAFVRPRESRVITSARIVRQAKRGRDGEDLSFNFARVAMLASALRRHTRNVVVGKGETQEMTVGHIYYAQICGLVVPWRVADFY